MGDCSKLNFNLSSLVLFAYCNRYKFSNFFLSWVFFENSILRDKTIDVNNSEPWKLERFKNLYPLFVLNKKRFPSSYRRAKFELFKWCKYFWSITLGSDIFNIIEEDDGLELKVILNCTIFEHLKKNLKCNCQNYHDIV